MNTIQTNFKCTYNKYFTVHVVVVSRTAPEVCLPPLYQFIIEKGHSYKEKKPQPCEDKAC